MSCRRRRPPKTYTEPDRLGCPECGSAEIGLAKTTRSELRGEQPRPELVGVYQCRECRARFRL